MLGQGVSQAQWGGPKHPPARRESVGSNVVVSSTTGRQLAGGRRLRRLEGFCRAKTVMRRVAPDTGSLGEESQMRAIHARRVSLSARRSRVVVVGGLALLGALLIFAVLLARAGGLLSPFVSAGHTPPPPTHGNSVLLL